MIPAKIHYCWFGKGQKPDSVLKYIETWKKHLPGYEIKEWNESNFDVNSLSYVKEAYESKKYAFVTDVVRLFALYTEGGIYLDTDVEVLKSFDPYLHHTAFIGYEDQNNIQTGVIASEKGGEWVKTCLDSYEDRRFILPDGSLDTTTNVNTITEYMSGKGLRKDNSHQDLPGLITVYPMEYFCAKSYSDGRVRVTDNTVTVHHYSGTWMTLDKKMKVFRARLIKRLNLTFIKNVINKLRGK